MKNIKLKRRAFGAWAIASVAGSRNAWAASAGVAKITFPELYKARTVLGMAFSDRTLQLAGKPVTISGYMAPPLKAESNFFVLTRQPVSICPFCSSDADWPLDIVVVYLAGSVEYMQDGSPINVTGTLQVGSSVDAATGFVSQLRVSDARVQRI